MTVLQKALRPPNEDGTVNAV